MEPQLLTISAFCTLYSCGRTKAYQLLASGAIEAVKIGGGTRIVAASADRWAATLPKFSPRQIVGCDEAGQ